MPVAVLDVSFAHNFKSTIPIAMKNLLFVSSLLFAVVESSVHFWVTPSDNEYEDKRMCGNMRNAYSRIIQITAEKELEPELFSIVSGVHALSYALDDLDEGLDVFLDEVESQPIGVMEYVTSTIGLAETATTTAAAAEEDPALTDATATGGGALVETTTAVLEPANRNLRGRELVDCGICESNPPFSIEACCIQVPYWQCGICMGSGGGRRRELGEEEEAQRLRNEIRLTRKLPKLNEKIKERLDERCAVELGQAIYGAPNCWSCDPKTETWNGEVKSLSLLES